MKLKDEFKSLPKDIAYDIYLSLVYSPKDYDKITKVKMLDEIIRQYDNNSYLYDICTEKELKFLKYIKNKKVNADDIQKYDWEINELNKKCIFSNITYDVYEEQINNVKSSLEYYKDHPSQKKVFDKITIFIVSLVKINAEMHTKVLMGIVQNIFGLTASDADKILGHPLIHFYCAFYDRYFELSGREEETIFYRDCYDALDELFELRKEYLVSGSKKIDIRDNYDVFYYGFPIRNKKVKKMYEEVQKLPMKNYIFNMVEEARILNDREFLEKLIADPKLLKIINDAIDEMPCAIMNGFTPNEYKKQIEIKKDLDEKFTIISQDNAHLSRKDADEFYKLYFALLDYANKKYQINPKIKKIYKQETLDVYQLQPIDTYLWNNKDIIDEFIALNPRHFSKKELEDTKEFKNSLTSDKLIIVGYTKEYTEILSEDGKLYMIKGIRANIDRIINPQAIPTVIKTTLLMFKGNIIFNGFFTSTKIKVDNETKQIILNKYNNSIRYYHL